MRGYFQQVRRQLVAHADTWIGWLLALSGTTVYLLTLEPTTSFWDCGEFIAVSYLIQVGHPPGAPFYQLLAHLFTLFAGSNAAMVAWWSNALSAVAGGCTVMFLYWTIMLLGAMPRRRQQHSLSTPTLRLAAVVGSLSYLVCDTAWFSAVESEVYSLAMLIASIAVWAMLHWYCDRDRAHAQRWLLLTALLLGLGACTHLLTLLTLPVLVLLIAIKGIKKLKKYKKGNVQIPLKSILNPKVFAFSFYLLVFTLLGLSPYLIIPIRATAGTPINEGHPSTVADLKSYILRDQYEKAPLYPRMWRHREHDAEYAASWCGGDTTFTGNMRYYFTYQFTYMYLRYLLWNFSGRYNDRQGYGSPQNGQFLTGIPPIDRLLVGTSAKIPPSLPSRGHNVYYLLPLLLGIVGLIALTRRRHAFWVVITLFLMGGIVLNIYLNHPTYEPRERDYAYILSFYAFCIFIAFGAEWIILKAKKYKQKTRKRLVSHLLTCISYLIIFSVPLLMACQNWDDHDRSHRYIARDAAANILNSCDRDERGTVLFCYGDNDTFPLWYLQTVEEERTDIRVENIGLMGAHNFVNLLSESIDLGRPIYFTHYAYNQYHHLFPNRLQLEGNAYRLMHEPVDSVALEPFYRHAMQAMGWHSLKRVYIDETSCKFLEQYWRDIVILAENLCDCGLPRQASNVLTKTLCEIPLDAIQNPLLIEAIAQALTQAGNQLQAQHAHEYLRQILTEQLDYYHTMPPYLQAAMPYTVGVREELASTFFLPSM